jgi:hypothetical protein
MGMWTPSVSSFGSARLINLLRYNSWLLAWALLPTIITGLVMTLSLVSLYQDKFDKVHRGEDKASLSATILTIASVIGVVLALIFAISIWWPDSPRNTALFRAGGQSMEWGLAPASNALHRDRCIMAEHERVRALERIRKVRSH